MPRQAQGADRRQDMERHPRRARGPEAPVPRRRQTMPSGDERRGRHGRIRVERHRVVRACEQGHRHRRGGYRRGDRRRVRHAPRRLRQGVGREAALGNRRAQRRRADQQRGARVQRGQVVRQHQDVRPGGDVRVVLGGRRGGVRHAGRG